MENVLTTLADISFRLVGVIDSSVMETIKVDKEKWRSVTPYLERSAPLTGYHAARALSIQLTTQLLRSERKTLSLTSVKFCSEINSRGKVLMPFLCNDKVFKLCKRAMLDGICSMKLSHRLSACRWERLPMESGMVWMRLPPRESRWRL